MTNILVLVTGVTGYIGGRLVPQLLQAGYRVRVLVRNRNRLQDRPWHQFETFPFSLGQTRLVQTAFFAPKSLLALRTGIFYIPFTA
jgi:uncharacterized protein YbjT (DUF2867 family)